MTVSQIFESGRSFDGASVIQSSGKAELQILSHYHEVLTGFITRPLRRILGCCVKQTLRKISKM